MMHARRRTPFTALNVDPSMGFFAPIFVSLSRHLISHTLEVKQALLFLFFSSFRKLNQTCSLAVQAKRKNRGMVDFWNREKGEGSKTRTIPCIEFLGDIVGWLSLRMGVLSYSQAVLSYLSVYTEGVNLAPSRV